MSDPSLWQEQHPGRAFPALDSEHRADVCVVGAGVTGASCAWRLLEHGLGVTVVDGRRAAAAASGRNGGFAVTGTGLDHDELAGRLGEAGARDLQAATERSLDAMIALAAELGVPQAVRRTGSLWVAQDEHERAEIERALSAAAAGIRCRPAADLIPDPMRDRCHTAAFFPRDAELLPATWVRTLAAAACRPRRHAVRALAGQRPRAPRRRLGRPRRRRDGARSGCGGGLRRADSAPAAAAGRHRLPGARPGARHRAAAAGPARIPHPLPIGLHVLPPHRRRPGRGRRRPARAARARVHRRGRPSRPGCRPGWTRFWPSGWASAAPA